ncbi:MAG TPA: hypothetical protein VEY71_07810 [Chitinophagales bacterium]|nr:hypothetical protein [Chitinophagales bacterium]
MTKKVANEDLFYFVEKSNGEISYSGPYSESEIKASFGNMERAAAAKQRKVERTRLWYMDTAVESSLAVKKGAVHTLGNGSRWRQISDYSVDLSLIKRNVVVIENDEKFYMWFPNNDEIELIEVVREK